MAGWSIKLAESNKGGVRLKWLEPSIKSCQVNDIPNLIQSNRADCLFYDRELNQLRRDFWRRPVASGASAKDGAPEGVERPR